MSENLHNDPDIRAAVSRIVTEYVFPGDTCHTPDVCTMIRAEKLGSLVKARMVALAADGIDPTAMDLGDLLPDCRPDDLELTEDDFLAYC